jgi:hypothetical protein
LAVAVNVLLEYCVKKLISISYLIISTGNFSLIHNCLFVAS